MKDGGEREIRSDMKGKGRGKAKIGEVIIRR